MKAPSPLSRRRFLQSAGLTGVLGATVGLPARAALSGKGSAAPRNLIFMVADGMSHGTLAAANHWLNLTAGRDTHWMGLYRDGLAHRALMETRSASSIVTDSAAASSSWGGGRRVPNGCINVDAEGRALTPLYAFAKEAGRRLGLVTTTTLTHATPAGFAAIQPSRDDQDAIAPQYLDRVDVLLGGGRPHFDPAQREDGRDLLAAYRRAGYTVVEDRKSLAAATGQPRLLGTFSGGHLPFALDRAHDPALASVPSLEMMVQTALRTLPGGDAGFLLQIEGGRIDHAGHHNDPATILAEMIEFDRCVGLVRSFAEERGDTLVIVTTDHGTGGFMLNGEGEHYNASSEHFLRLGSPTASFDALGGRHLQRPLPVETVLGALALPDEPRFRDPLEKLLPVWQGHPADLANVLHEPLAHWFATSWTTRNHTGELAEFAAFGPGHDAFAGFFENWEVHHRLREILAL